MYLLLSQLRRLRHRGWQLAPIASYLALSPGANVSASPCPLFCISASAISIACCDLAIARFLFLFFSLVIYALSLLGHHRVRCSVFLRCFCWLLLLVGRLACMDLCNGHRRRVVDVFYFVQIVSGLSATQRVSSVGRAQVSYLLNLLRTFARTSGITSGIGRIPY